jgi:hypothetical protein
MLPSGVTRPPSGTNGTPANFQKKIKNFDMFMDIPLASSIKISW